MKISPAARGPLPAFLALGSRSPERSRDVAAMPLRGESLGLIPRAGGGRHDRLSGESEGCYGSSEVAIVAPWPSYVVVSNGRAP